MRAPAVLSRSRAMSCSGFTASAMAWAGEEIFTDASGVPPCERHSASASSPSSAPEIATFSTPALCSW